MKISFLPLICLSLALAGCTTYRDPSQQQPGMLGAPVTVERTSLGYDKVDDVGTGMLVPNASGGTMLIPGAKRNGPNPYYEEAVELKLKAREIAAQLLDTHNNSALTGLVAMPVSFVNLDDFNDSSPLGRYLAEAMFYEFNQREFPVREYRLTGSIALREGVGEVAISRSLPPIATNQSWAALLIGTYQRDPSAIFVNARLVRPADGLVLRTAQLVLPLNSLNTRMTTPPPKPPKPLFDSGTLRITSK